MDRTVTREGIGEAFRSSCTTGATPAARVGKAREPRRKVLLRARMQTGRNWVDVTIHNVSSRGLMAQGATRAERGCYVEIRHRTQVIIGRVVWANAGCFGLRTRDPIDLAALLGEPDLPRSGERRHSARAVLTEPRKVTVSERYMASRRLSSTLQMAGITIVTIAAALLLAREVHSSLVQPLDAVREAMRRPAATAAQVPAQG